jgi:hypothetical protein
MITRADVTDFIVSNIALMIPGDDYNPNVTRSRLEAMSDAEFDAYMRSLAKPETEEEKATQEILPFVSPPMDDTRLTMDNLMLVADNVGLKLFERLWITDPQTGVTYLTPNEYPVLDMLVRRQAQMLTKKSSIPEDARHVDEMSGQVTGKSKGSKISFPEVQAQLAQNLTSTLIEEIKIRGGDESAQLEFDRQLIEHGEANIDDVTTDGQVTKSTSNTAILFRGMMIDTDLDEV